MIQIIANDYKKMDETSRLICKVVIGSYIIILSIAIGLLIHNWKTD